MRANSSMSRCRRRAIRRSRACDSHCVRRVQVVWFVVWVMARRYGLKAPASSMKTLDLLRRGDGACDRRLTTAEHPQAEVEAEVARRVAATLEETAVAATTRTGVAVGAHLF